jgi:hypothetical protein
MGSFGLSAGGGTAKTLRKIRWVGRKAISHSTPQPQDDIKVFVDPGLRLMVVETVKIINVDGQVRVGQMGTGGRSKKIAD